MKQIKSISRKNIFIGISIFLILLYISIFFGWIYINPTIEISQITPNWKGIIPGQTTKAEVISILGEPEKIHECYAERWIFGYGNKFSENIYLIDCKLSNYVTYFYPAYYIGKLNSDHEIHFENDVVTHIAESLIGSPEDHELKTPEKVFEYFGHPEDMLWSMRDTGRYAILYCSQGVLIQTRSHSVNNILYFTPMNQNRCLSKFWFEVARSDPFEGGGNVLYSKDPWSIMDD